MMLTREELMNLNDKTYLLSITVQEENAALRAQLEHHKWKQEQNEQEVDRLRQQVETSMQTQEALAKNVNDELLEIRQLRQRTMARWSLEKKPKPGGS